MPEDRQQRREPVEQPERRIKESESTRMSQPAHDAEMLEAVGGSRPQTNPGTGPSGVPTNRAAELTGDMVREEALMEGQFEVMPPTPPTPPQSSPSENTEGDNS